MHRLKSLIRPSTKISTPTATPRGKTPSGTAYATSARHSTISRPSRLLIRCPSTNCPSSTGSRSMPTILPPTHGSEEPNSTMALRSAIPSATIATSTSTAPSTSKRSTITSPSSKRPTSSSKSPRTPRNSRRKRPTLGKTPKACPAVHPLGKTGRTPRTKRNSPRTRTPSRRRLPSWATVPSNCSTARRQSACSSQPATRTAARWKSNGRP